MDVNTYLCLNTNAGWYNILINQPRQLTTELINHMVVILAPHEIIALTTNICISYNMYGSCSVRNYKNYKLFSKWPAWDKMLIFYLGLIYHNIITLFWILMICMCYLKAKTKPADVQNVTQVKVFRRVDPVSMVLWQWDTSLGLGSEWHPW